MESDTIVIVPESGGEEEDGGDIDGEIQISINPDYDDGIDDGDIDDGDIDSEMSEDKPPTKNQPPTKNHSPVEKNSHFECGQCTRSFVSAWLLSQHMVNHEYKRAYVCRHCHIECSTEMDLHQHLKRHTGEMPFMCNVCGKGFGNVYHYRSHYRTHTGEKPYKCGICGKRFTTSTGLRYHERTRSGEKCSIRVNSKPRVRPKELDDNECKQLVVYVDPPPEYSNLIKHSGKDSTQEKEVGSSKTEEKSEERVSFFTDPELMTNAEKFNLALSFKESSECMICGKKFQYPSSLKTHLRVHSNDEIDHTLKLMYQSSDDESLKESVPWKPYACKECGHECCTSEELKTHMLTHSSEKPHFCKYCGKCFGKTHNLYAHIRTHTGEKPFKCVDCGKRFTTSTGFRYHNKAHHAGSATHSSDKSEEKDTAKDTLDDGFLKIVSVTSLADNPSSEIHPTMYAGITDGSTELADENSSEIVNSKVNSEIPESSPDCDLTIHHTETATMILSADDITEIDKQIDNKTRLQLECGVCGTEFIEETGLEKHMKKHRAIRRKKAKSSIVSPSQLQQTSEAQESDDMINNVPEPDSYKSAVNEDGEDEGEGFQLPVLLEGSVHSIAGDQGLFLVDLPDDSAPDDSAPNDSAPNDSAPTTLEIDGVIVQPHYPESDSGEVPEPIAEAISPSDSSVPSQEQFTCPACNTVVNSIAGLEAHFKEHTTINEPMKYACKYCSRTFWKKYNLHSHLKTHAGENVYLCSYCPKTFTNVSGRDGHIAKEHAEFKFVLDTLDSNSGIINASFRNKIQDAFLRVATESVPNQNEDKLDEEPPVDVPVPEVTYLYDSAPVEPVHINSLAVEPEVSAIETTNTRGKCECKICGKVVSHRQNLKMHMRVHQDKKTYRCLVCSKELTTNYQFTVHMRTHTGERPYQCEICRKRFRKRNHYTNHRRTHLGIRPFHCHICQKRFTASNGLKYHLTHVHKPGKASNPKWMADPVKDNDEVNSKAAELEAIADPDDVPLMQLQAYEDLKNSDTSTLCAEIAERMKKTIKPQGFVLPSPKLSPVSNATVSKAEVSSPEVESPAQQPPPNDSVTESDGALYDTSNPTNSAVDDANLKEFMDIDLTDSTFPLRRKSKRKSSTPSYYGIKIKKDITKPSKSPVEKSRSESSYVLSLESMMGPAGYDPAVKRMNTLKGGYHKETVDDKKMKRLPDDVLVMTQAEREFAAGSQDQANDLSDDVYIKQVLNNSAHYIYGTDVDGQGGADVPEMFKLCRVCQCNIPVAEYDVHVIEHSARRFKCNFCNLKFTRSELLEHEKCHPKETPFECVQCGKGFWYAAALQKHRKLHKNKKKYECLYCGKFFGKTDNLKSHVRTHTGEKPYSCSICDRRFTTSTGLRYHDRHRTIGNCHKGIKIKNKNTYEQAFEIITEAAKMGKTREDIALMSNKSKAASNTYQLDSKQVLVFPKKPVVNVPKNIAMKETLKQLKSYSVLPAEVEHIFNAPDQNTNCNRTPKCDGYRVSKDGSSQCSYCLKLNKTREDVAPMSSKVQEPTDGTSQLSDLKNSTDLKTKLKSTQCHFCLKYMSDQSGLRKHLRIHTGEKPYECKICGMRFSRCDYLSKHIFQHYDETLYPCRHCDQSFTIFNLKKHKAKYHGMSLKPRKYTQMYKEEWTELASHEGSEDSLQCLEQNDPHNDDPQDDDPQNDYPHDDNPQNDDLQNSYPQNGDLQKAYPQNDDLQNAYPRNENLQKAYPQNENLQNDDPQNDDLQNAYPQNDDLQNPENCVDQLQYLEESDDLQCTKCGRSFTNDRLFHIHCGICTGDDTLEKQSEEPDVTVTFEGFEITCSPPGSDVDDQDDDEEDQKKEDEDEEDDSFEEEEGIKEVMPTPKNRKKHYCTSCSKEFTVFADMIQHLQSHSGTKNFPCPHPKCSFTFRSMTALEKHELEHYGSRSLTPENSCNLCGKVFTSQELLKAHFPVHLGDETYKCSMCSRSYKEFRALNVHVKSCCHKELEFVRPFACSFCDKQFRKQDHIKTHIRTHTGEKPYECGVCKKGFAASTGLRLHQKRGPPYLCAPESMRQYLMKVGYSRKRPATSSSSRVRSLSKAMKRSIRAGKMKSMTSTYAEEPGKRKLRSRSGNE